jgi:hypothetical protein
MKFFFFLSLLFLPIFLISQERDDSKFYLNENYKEDMRLGYPFQRKKQIFFKPYKEVVDFEKKYNWFSSTHALVGKVTDNQEDIQLVCDLLEDIAIKESSFPYRYLSILEIITKVLAYRDLKLGQEIKIPVDEGGEKLKLVVYKVDKVFDIWNGMPAFGLIPKANKNFASILIYRGTDISLRSKSSWFSLLSDLDLAGPGHTAFNHSHIDIHNWLEKVKKQEHPARIMGFSLGGILAYYTLLFEHDLIAKQEHNCSIAFSPPGITKNLVKKWNNIKVEKPLIKVFITKNDLISRKGHFFGEIYLLSTKKKMQHLQAHVGLTTAQSFFKMTPYKGSKNFFKKRFHKCVAFFKKHSNKSV